MNINFFIYASIILFNYIKNNEVIIPFKSILSTISKNLSPMDFMSSLINNELYINLNIGNPPQNLDFLLDFNLFHTYIIKDNNKNKNYKRFNHNISTTFRYIGKKDYFHNLGFFSAINSSDIVTINDNLKNFNFTFFYLIDLAPATSDKYPGIIGFGVVPNGQPFYYVTGIIYQLKQKNITNNYIYTLVYNKNDYNGKIIIGKNIHDNYPPDNFMEDYCLITSFNFYYWGWNYITSYLDLEQLNITQIYFKPELGVIVLNNKIKDIIKNKYFIEKIEEGKCFEDYNKKYSFFYCDKDITINIGKFNFINSNKGIEFSLEKNDLILEYNNKIFLLILFDIHLLDDEAYLGYPFFKKFDLIFNQDTKTVGFYKNIKNEKKDNKEENNKTYDNIKFEKNNNLLKKLVPFFVFLCVLFVLYLVFYIYRKIKRKTNEKLFEELNVEIND